MLIRPRRISWQRSQAASHAPLTLRDRIQLGEVGMPWNSLHLYQNKKCMKKQISSESSFTSLDDVWGSAGKFTKARNSIQPVANTNFTKLNSSVRRECNNGDGESQKTAKSFRNCIKKLVNKEGVNASAAKQLLGEVRNGHFPTCEAPETHSQGGGEGTYLSIWEWHYDNKWSVLSD